MGKIKRGLKWARAIVLKSGEVDGADYNALVSERNTILTALDELGEDIAKSIR